MKNDPIRFIRCNQAQFDTLKGEENIRAVKGIYMQDNKLYFVIDDEQVDFSNKICYNNNRVEKEQNPFLQDFKLLF